jgi:glyoxylase-like metal-dependent hydrolase (beta-lactamase superfamily II)
MIIKHLAVTIFQSNCFILGCEKTRKAGVIDPGGEVNVILNNLTKDRLILKYIINTHGHADHVGGNKALKEATGAELLIHEDDAGFLAHSSQMAAMFGVKADSSPSPDRLLKEGDIINIGEEIALRVLHTPGHSAGGISLLLEGENMVFAGDTLFAGSIGRTDLPDGSYETLISSVRDKIFPLGDEMRVFPGHGPSTTVGEEKRYNPFFR